jgi:hypothetical protein
MALETLQAALDDLESGRMDATAFCRVARATRVPSELPARYGEVLGALLDRLESAALFDGESCSFSQHDLLANLREWLAKARERLAAPE